MHRKTPLAAAMALVLALGLCPAAGYADEGGADLAAGSALTAQADSKTIWVRTQSSYDKSNMPPTTYKYDKNGLLSEISSWSWTNTTADNKIERKTLFTYNASGQLTKTRQPDGNHDAYKTTYTYKGGKLAKSSNRVYGVKTAYTTTYKTDASGRVTKATGKQDGSTRTFTYNSNGTLKKMDGTAYTYDGKGNVTKKKVTGYSGATKFKNTYKSGRLVKRKVTGGYSAGTYSFKYEKVTVPAKYAKQVQQQQRELINPSALNVSDWMYL